MRFILPAYLIVLLGTIGCGSDLECGPGTHKSGDQCLPGGTGEPGTYEERCQVLCDNNDIEEFCTQEIVDSCLTECRSRTNELPVLCATCILDNSEDMGIECGGESCACSPMNFEPISSETCLPLCSEC
jgi:hypothetical protein